MRTETGLGVLHLFCKPTAIVDREAVHAAVKAVQAADGQVVTAAMLGHKCDLAVMALHPDWSVLRALQGSLQAAGLEVVDSYVSITEVSEYAKGMPEHMLHERLYPTLPPEGKPVFVITTDVVSFGKLARFFRDELKVRNALYLDGSVSSLWDPANGRLDDFVELGPLIVSFKAPAGSARHRAARATP